MSTGGLFGRSKVERKNEMPASMRPEWALARGFGESFSKAV